MAVALEIRDGNPWYLSPDVWTVPGDDPDGPPGQPIVGRPCYLWARVRNNGSSTAQDATVLFYWADPSVGFDRTTASLVGSSFVTLSPGASADVLCLTPWNPVYVNQGHECILAEAFHPSDPLPAAKDFNVPTDRHVAQRNLSVLQAAQANFSFSFSVHNTSRLTQAITVVLEQQPIGAVAELLPLLNLRPEVAELEGRIHKLGLARVPYPRDEELRDFETGETVHLRPFERAGLTLVGFLEGDAALLHVRALDEEREQGGLAMLVLRDKDRYQERQEEAVGA
jgi:hypothetical protein